MSSFCLVPMLLCAQSQGSVTATADSLVFTAADSALLDWNAATEYGIARLRVQRWLAKNRNKSSSVVANITELLQEADDLAQAQDYATAQLLLETALDLIDTATTAAVPATPDVDTAAPYLASTPGAQHWQTQQEILTGVDFSHLEYVLGSPELDELFEDFAARSVRSSGNPFAGFRFQIMQTPASANDLRLMALLKTSRDYDTGTLELAARRELAAAALLQFENDFETTAYRLETDLHYWQNASLLRLGLNLGRNFRAEMAEDWRVRRYREEDLYSPNYLQNDLGLELTCNAGLATRLQARYDFGVRAHAHFPVNDYSEHRLDFSITQNTSQNSTVFVQNIWRTRDYPHGIPDSTFQNSYQEEFLRGDLRFGMSPRVALRLEGDLTLRQYGTRSGLTPDFFNAKLNPELEYKLGNAWQVSGGYLFLLQVHGTREQGTLASSTSTALYGGFYEDYYANGFTLGLEWLGARNVLLSLNHTYEVRTYPHDPLKNTLVPSLYTDYNNHTLLLFLSWKLSRHWQLSAVANYDNQTSRLETGDDLRNTLVSVEMGYAF